MIKTLIFIILFMPALSQAAIRGINTDSNLWKKLDQILNNDRLCDSFKNKSNYKIKRKTCSKFGCENWQYVIKSSCSTNLEGESVATLEYWKLGKIFSKQSYSSTQWQNINGNLLCNKALLAESLGHRFTLQNLEETSGLIKASYIVENEKTVLAKGYWLVDAKAVSAISQIIERHNTSFGVLTEKNSDILINQR